MTKMSRQYTLATSHGSIAVEETGHGGLPTLLIHGNSSCRGVFRNQMEGPLAKNHRLIAFDLPGHGQSSDAPDPSRSYTRPGFADAAIEMLGGLQPADTKSARCWRQKSGYGVLPAFRCISATVLQIMW